MRRRSQITAAQRLLRMRDRKDDSLDAFCYSSLLRLDCAARVRGATCVLVVHLAPHARTHTLGCMTGPAKAQARPTEPWREYQENWYAMSRPHETPDFPGAARGILHECVAECARVSRCFDRRIVLADRWGGASEGWREHFRNHSTLSMQGCGSGTTGRHAWHRTRAVCQ